MSKTSDFINKDLDEESLDVETFAWICLMSKLWFGFVPNYDFGSQSHPRLLQGGIKPSGCAIILIDESAGERFAEDLKSALMQQQKVIWCQRLSESVGKARGRLASSRGSSKASHALMRAHTGSRHKTLCVSWFNFKIEGPLVVEVLPSPQGCKDWRVSKEAATLFSFPAICDISELLRTDTITLATPRCLPLCSREDENKLFSNAPQSPFNVEGLKLFRNKLTDGSLLEKVILALSAGHEADFAAVKLDEVYRDFSTPESSKEEIAFKKKTLRKYAKNNHAIGPFKKPPFPNSKNPFQPTVNSSFTIPKDKLAAVGPDAKRRYIVHASDPDHLSLNFHLPRQATGRSTHTCAHFHSRVARLGPGSLVMFMDMKDCFMNFVLKVTEWHRQCVRVDEEFWVIPVGMFGSRSAGDFAENFTTIVTDIFKEFLNMPNVRVYVDNFDNVVAPISPGVPNWHQANIEWNSMLQLAKLLGIPMHEHLAPTLKWGAIAENGTEIDGHLGWGGESVPRPRVWVPLKKRKRILLLASQWASQRKFSCSEIGSIVGIFQSLQIVLRYLGKYLSLLISWQTKCERSVRLRLTGNRKMKVFSNGHVGRVLRGITQSMESKNWAVPMVDWHDASRASDKIVSVYADAATPKKFGTSYNSKVWGKGAYCTYTTAEGKNDIVLMQKHQLPSIKAAKRNLALSSALLELENYIQSIIMIAKRSKARSLCIVGDCKVALDWIDNCIPKDINAKRLVAILCDAQLELQFTLKTLWKSNNDETIKIADRLSKGDDVLLQEMLNAGYVRLQYEQAQWWQDGSESC
jgi:hypothetical protein